MSKITILCLAALLLGGCDVKKRKAPSGEGRAALSASPSGELFAAGSGIYLSDHGRFLVHPSLTNFVSNDSNTVTYWLWAGGVNEGTEPRLSLEPLTGQLSAKVEYEMPEMKTMDIMPATIAVPGPGRVEVTYVISMPGWWRVTLSLFRGGTLLDTFTRDYNVPES